MLRRASPLLLLVTALAGCPKAPPKVSMPPKPEVKIPTGCEANLSGEWVHTRDDSFRYTATDDGHTLTLTATRTPATSTRTGSESASGRDGDQGGTGEGGEARAEDEAAGVAPTITLERTAKGFRGNTVAEQYLPDGQRCEVPYPTEVIGCTEAMLTLSTATFVAVDVECRVAPTSDESPREQHRLERVKPSPDDAQGGLESPAPAPAS